MADKFDKATRSKIMAKIRSKNTSTEVHFKKLLKKNGLTGYRSHYNIIGNPDIAFPSKKIAVFIDGDFWHGYNWKNLKKIPPKIYWQNKIERNMKRDVIYTKELRKQGWKVLRFWEHKLLKTPNKCVQRIENAYSNRIYV